MQLKNEKFIRLVMITERFVSIAFPSFPWGRIILIMSPASVIYFLRTELEGLSEVFKTNSLV